MLKLFVAFGVGLSLLGAVALGPTIFKAPRLSAVPARSVRVESIPPPRPVVVHTSRSSGSSWSSGSSSSGRYSSGGGFSSGK